MPYYCQMELHVVNTGFFKLDGGAMFGVVPRQLWQKLNSPDENNLCTWAMRCLLVTDGDKALLIDNGIGTKQDAKFFGHYHLHGDYSLQGSLAKAGLQPSQITQNLLTHLHFDHCGGGVQRQGDRYELTFPNAQYLTNAAHWAWATQPNAREKASFLSENIQPMQNLGAITFLEDHKVPGWPAIEVIKVNGHTEEQMLPLISYKGHKILFCADLLPSAAHLPIAWVMAYDVRPLQTLVEKEIILNRAVDEGWVLFFEHDPVNECATLERTEKGIRIKATFPLAEIL